MPAKSHGGARRGAGRPKGQGRFREPTRPIRVPESLLDTVTDWLAQQAQTQFPTQGRSTESAIASNDADHGLPPHLVSDKVLPFRRPNRLAELDDFRRPVADPHPLPLPLYGSRVSAGFPSPADDYLEDTLDLNEHLIAHPAATFMVRVSGDSMLGAGIHPGDVLVVDRALEATDGRIVIAVLDGELTVKRLSLKGTTVRLLPENPDYAPIVVREAQDFQIWGVVTSVIHKL
ncbi:hypothetical protein A9404_03610 [Halothiobacillus diazotrophicus]|uniref:Peptidase S24/S26A/S26B/S26C domain-containing protein n=1 Tax=Halothiobacillus diazotrophicus TaxID=1860122 RepID=A0A191ZK91_9GAMM|nr:hypothetical protein A9404_03610 [Halothiobacillus diazotrophicus]